jgi:hypothetical protein
MALLLIIIAQNGHILANIAIVSQLPLAIDLSSKGLPGQLQMILTNHLIGICLQVGWPPAASSAYNFSDVQEAGARWGSVSRDPMIANQHTG